jgi:hypothetical protein
LPGVLPAEFNLRNLFDPLRRNMSRMIKKNAGRNLPARKWR